MADPLYYLLKLLSLGRLMKVSFLPVSYFAVLLKTFSSEFQQSVPPLAEQLSLSNSCHSHELYDVFLGLHPYVRYGG